MIIRNIKLTTRALMSVGIICLLLIALGAATLFKMNSIHKAASDLNDNWVPSVKQAGRIEVATLQYRLHSRRFVMNDARLSDASIKTINQLKANLTVLVAVMLANLKVTTQHISDSSGQLASAAGKMSSITRESNTGIQRQNMETEQAATAVTQMAAAVEEVGRTAVVGRFSV